MVPVVPVVPVALVAAATLPLLALAANHPASTQPCHSGSCRWEHTDDYGYGRFDMTGFVSSISDLTPSAGWTILDCDPSATDQDIRVVCHDPSKGCDHLYLNGAHHTIVRLPDECGSTAFAFVKNEWVHQDQSIRGRKRHMLVHREGSQPVVKGITLSTNYSELDHTRHGEVSFDAIGFSGSVFADEDSDCKPHLHGLLDWQLNCTGATAPQSFNRIHTDNLFNKSLDCPQQGSVPSYNTDLSADFTTNITGSVIFGWSLVGTTTHPTQHFDIYFGVNTTIEGTLDLHANLNGSLSSGKKELAVVPLVPGTGIPGVVVIGPAIKFSAQADAILDANVDLSVDMAYAITDAKLYFPDGPTSGNFNFDNSSSGLQLSASPSAGVDGNVSVHLIPSLSLDFELMKFVHTSVNLDLDASAGLNMSIYTGVDASTSTEGSSSAGADWGGSLDATTSLNIDVSADLDLPPLYNKGDTKSLWNDTWPLYSTSFNGSAPIGRRAYIDQGDAVMGSYRDRVLNRYMKNATPASNAAASLPSGCGTNGNSSLLPVVPRKANGKSSH